MQGIVNFMLPVEYLEPPKVHGLLQGSARCTETRWSK